MKKLEIIAIFIGLFLLIPIAMVVFLVPIGRSIESEAREPRTQKPP